MCKEFQITFCWCEKITFSVILVLVLCLNNFSYYYRIKVNYSKCKNKHVIWLYFFFSANKSYFCLYTVWPTWNWNTHIKFELVRFWRLFSNCRVLKVSFGKVSFIYTKIKAHSIRFFLCENLGNCLIFNLYGFCFFQDPLYIP